MLPSKVWVHQSPTALARARACFEDVRKYALSRGWWQQYTWVVKARPDLVFYREVSNLG